LSWEYGKNGGLDDDILAARDIVNEAGGPAGATLHRSAPVVLYVEGPSLRATRFRRSLDPDDGVDREERSQTGKSLVRIPIQNSLQDRIGIELFVSTQGACRFSGGSWTPNSSVKIRG
jgi:hypothetical protein